MIANARIDGDLGEDVITILNANTGVSINGGADNDTITAYGNATEGATVDGGTGNDVIDTGMDRTDVRANDTIRGGTGDDTIWTGGGQDYLDGGTGNDLLYAGDGNDLLVGGDGKDVMYGENGNDTFLFSRDIGYTTQTFELNSKTIDLYQVDLGVEGLRGSNDEFDGGEGSDTVLGTGGNDYIQGSKMTSIEEVRAGGGNDLVDMRSYAGPVVVINANSFTSQASSSRAGTATTS